MELSKEDITYLNNVKSDVHGRFFQLPDRNTSLKDSFERVKIVYITFDEADNLDEVQEQEDFEIGLIRFTDNYEEISPRRHQNEIADPQTQETATNQEVPVRRNPRAPDPEEPENADPEEPENADPKEPENADPEEPEEDQETYDLPDRNTSLKDSFERVKIVYITFDEADNLDEVQEQEDFEIGLIRFTDNYEEISPRRHQNEIADPQTQETATNQEVPVRRNPRAPDPEEPENADPEEPENADPKEPENADPEEPEEDQETYDAEEQEDSEPDEDEVATLLPDRNTSLKDSFERVKIVYITFDEADNLDEVQEQEDFEIGLIRFTDNYEEISPRRHQNEIADPQTQETATNQEVPVRRNPRAPDPEEPENADPEEPENADPKEPENADPEEPEEDQETSDAEEQRSQETERS
ncbi:uncharacterized protein [Spinacia oleracea]|uniref:DUF4283 domain-containing protein n=1 Tax=Spinacia oleracea TaxID=3562 RepID=A0ABM3RSA5_SPIOL|nr:uncharacterized protein LOC110784777 [Spinacia oleracea]